MNCEFNTQSNRSNKYNGWHCAELHISDAHEAKQLSGYN